MTVTNAVEITEKVVPYLTDKGIEYKVIKDLYELVSLNSGFYGYTQIGKCITVYPDDNDEFITVLKDLQSMLKGFKCPKVPFDKQVETNSVIFYRYGSYKSKFIKDEHGREIDDNRKVPIPKWINDPYKGAAKQDTQNRLLNNRYLIISVLRQRGKGGVYLSLDIKNKGKLYVIKEGRKYGEVEATGIDAYKRSMWENEILLDLQDINGVVQIHESFETEEAFYNVTFFQEGISLKEAILKSKKFKIQTIVDIGLNLLMVLKKIHSRGYIVGDISLDNIIINEQYNITLTDLETAYKREGQIPYSNIKTLGFYPQDTKKSEPEFGDDLFAIGAIMYTLFNNKPYKEFISYSIETTKKMEIKAWDRPKLPDSISIQLSECIENSISSDPLKRYKTADEFMKDINYFKEEVTDAIYE